MSRNLLYLKNYNIFKAISFFSLKIIDYMVQYSK